MKLPDKRRAIRSLLDERNPADAQAIYYAYNHPDEKTQLITYPPEASVAKGYVCIARTGIDLFRPLLTMRLPIFRRSQEIRGENREKMTFPFGRDFFFYKSMTRGTGKVFSDCRLREGLT